MHTVALQLVPVLAAEKSKVPFYVAGGALVLWALFVSLGLGMRKPDFPGNLGGQRLLSAITALLVLAAVSTAVITSGGSAKPAQASTGAQAVTETAATTPAATASTPAPAPAATAHTELQLAADAGGQLLYLTKQLRAKAGTVTIKFTNASPVEHNATVAQGSAVAGATPTFTGGARTLTLKLKPGTYTFYCTVPGHRQAGMEGTLTVA